MGGTRIDEVGDGIFRISTAFAAAEGGFSFNQYLILDDEPLLYHTGPRRMFDGLAEAVARVMPLDRLRWIGLSHFEADECGALNQLLAAAPAALPICGRIAAMTSIADYADRPPRVLADGERMALGRREVQWFDTPHLPHGWECGHLLETTSATLLCGDLFTQPGLGRTAVTEDDILEPSEAMRGGMDYFAHGAGTSALLARLAQTRPRLLACMHGSAWAGDGGALLLELARRLQPGPG